MTKFIYQALMIVTRHNGGIDDIQSFEKVYAFTTLTGYVAV